jgi:hypothetical protein
MPGQDQYVKLPDGSYVHVPGTATPQQLSQLRDKLSTQFADPLKTGKGMEDAAHAQARPGPSGLPGGGNPSYAAMAVENSPSGADPHNPANPNQQAMPAEMRPEVNSNLLTAASLTTPMVGGAMEGVPGIMRAGRGLIGAGVGGGLGEGAGSRLGGLFGETGKKVGGTIGAVGGSLLGGGLAGGLERNPATSAQSMRGEPGSVKALPFGMQRFIPESMVPKGEIGTPTNPGPFANLPARMPSSSLRNAASAAPSGESSVAGTRSLVLTPSEAQSESVMQRIATKRASERGMQFAGGMTPREGRKVPKLPSQMQDEEYPGPRESVRFPSDDEEQ